MRKNEYIVKFGSLYKYDCSNMIDNIAMVVSLEDGNVIRFGDRDKDGETLKNNLEHRRNNLISIGYSEEADKLRYLEIDTARPEFGIDKGLPPEQACSILNFCINCSGEGTKELFNGIINNDIEQVTRIIKEIQGAGY